MIKRTDNRSKLKISSQNSAKKFRAFVLDSRCTKPMMQSFASIALLIAMLSILGRAQNLLESQSTQSKKCTQYGHSCLGGHGKRSLVFSPSITEEPLQTKLDPYFVLFPALFKKNNSIKSSATFNKNLPLSLSLYIRSEKGVSDHKPTMSSHTKSFSLWRNRYSNENDD
ncbi:uncharacterized protein NH340_JMT04563 [Sarcoptes scabiei]|nr:uncharacterized protein NH340_JMT04563 [Sarcoptes scabiei]